MSVNNGTFLNWNLVISRNYFSDYRKISLGLPATISHNFLFIPLIVTLAIFKIVLASIRYAAFKRHPE
jgi:hypothetical protein